MPCRARVAPTAPGRRLCALRGLIPPKPPKPFNEVLSPFAVRLIPRQQLFRRSIRSVGPIQTSGSRHNLGANKALAADVALIPSINPTVILP